MLRRKRGDRRCVLVDITDTHAGHLMGLLNPATVLVRHDPETGVKQDWTPELTTTQRRLWKLMESACEQIGEFAGRDPVIVFHGGDATNGRVFPNGLIPGTLYSDQREIAAWNLQPLARLPTLRAMRLITGTYVHVHDSAEAKVVARLREVVPGTDIDICHHLRPTIRDQGVVLDVAHHGPSEGVRDWLHGNVARFHLRDRMALDRRYSPEGQPARMYLYHHYHTWVRETIHECWQGEYLTSELYVVPSMCGFTDHARQITRSKPFLTNGLMMWEIVNGHVGEPVMLTETIDLRKREEL